MAGEPLLDCKEARFERLEPAVGPLPIAGELGAELAQLDARRLQRDNLRLVGHL